MSKPKALILAAAAILALSLGIWLGILVCHYTTPILMYHYINDEEPLRSKLGVSIKSFERQMRFLKEHKYNVIPLDELVNAIKAGQRLPAKTVCITFDDGYLDNYTNAYPILKKYNLPAAIFVVIDRIGKRLGNDDYMNWRQIEEVAGSGLISIGSHSMTHPNLSEVTSEVSLKYEIRESKIILEERLKKKVDFFSYPFGGISAKARELAIEAGYKASVATNLSRYHPNNDIYALKRLRISENCRNLFIFWVETSGLYTYIKEHRDDD